MKMSPVVTGVEGYQNVSTRMWKALGCVAFWEKEGILKARKQGQSWRNSLHFEGSQTWGFTENRRCQLLLTKNWEFSSKLPTLLQGTVNNRKSPNLSNAQALNPLTR